MEKPKKCPFCGKIKWVKVTSVNEKCDAVECKNCNAHGPWNCSTSGAIKDWNKALRKK